MADEATQETATEAVEETQDVAGESTADNEQGQEVEGAEVLSDAGKQALDRMKAKWKEADRLAKEREAALAELQAKADGREAEHQAEIERRKVEEDALAKANERILKAEVRANAAAKLADPADALRFIDLSEFEVGTEGDVDAEAISAAIDDLLKSKPYLAAQGGSGPVFESPGSHREPGKGQVSDSELKRMTPDQINAARAEGRLNDLLGIKN